MRPLSIFEQYVRRAYETDLRSQLASHRLAQGAASWFFVDERDYSRVIPDESPIGLLADSEVGLLLYVVDYQGGDLQTEISRVLTVSSRASRPTSCDEADSHGGWRVGLLWLVKHEDETLWREAIAERRRRSGSSEELYIDVVFYGGAISLEARLQANRLPILLLRCRDLLRKSESEVAAWSSANADVLKEMQDLESSLSKPVERELARRVASVATASSVELRPQDRLNEPRQSLESIRLRNFRNIEKLAIDFKSDKTAGVGVDVLFGPNGSGKSSIVEAITIGTVGYSKSMWEFEQDEDQSRGTSYSDGALKRLGSESGPEIELNGNVRTEFGGGSADSALRRVDGSILSQERSVEFVRKRGVELAADALRDYSRVADDILDFVERETKIASEQKDRLLRDLGERVSITKLETILARVARNAISADMPQDPRQLVQWLQDFQKLEHSKRTVVEKLLQTISRLCSSDRRVELEQQVVKRLNPLNSASLEELFAQWFESWNLLASEISQFFEDLAVEFGPWSEWIDERVQDLTTWAEALGQRSDTFSEVRGSAAGIAAMQEKRATLERQLESSLMRGKAARSHLSHLESIASFVSLWSSEHPNECPTCGAIHDDGIDTAFARVMEYERARRDELAASYEKTKAGLEAVQKLLSQAGTGDSVIGKTRESVLRAMLGREFAGEPIESILTSSTGADEARRLFMALRIRPSLPSPVALPDEAGRVISARIKLRAEEARRALELPSYWAIVASEVRKRCEKVLIEKMPDTLMAVWLELVWALTPARWIYAAQPSIDVSSQRKNRKMSIIAKNGDGRILAKYFFNLSECHIFGLAWFFLRYLTSGRFRYEFLVLDDPAQEMDQTTFGAFTRFLAALARIHRGRGVPLTVLVLMHQEERALQIARATNGIIHVLPWVGVQRASGGAEVRHVRLFQPGLGMPRITELLDNFGVTPTGEELR